MSNTRFIFGFHPITSRLRQNPDSIKEIYLDSERRDQRIRDLTKLAEASQIHLISCDQERLMSMAGGKRHQGVVANIDATKVYVDIDDVLSRTIESLIDLLDALHGRRVEVSDVRHFDLGRSFRLTEEETVAFMDRAHADEIIEAIQPTSGGVEVLANWEAAGDRVSLVTGRPPSTYEASRRWLSEHQIKHESLHHLDKWRRPEWNPGGLPSIEFQEIRAFEFDFAVEDSLDTAIRLVEEFDIPVALMDRPWNRSTEDVSTQTQSKLVRCTSWEEVDRAFA